ncbi:MAG TPA: VWA domain-containing protein [Vicinamibacterales bacterium]
MKVLAVLVVAVVLAPAGARAQMFDIPPVPPLPQPATVQSSAQNSAEAQTPPRTFRSSASLVALNVTVTDGAKFVSGLQPSDFVVYEDGVKQDVKFFESASVPVDLILLIDTSASMGDKLDVVHEAATGFLKTMRPGDRGAVVTFSDSVSVAQPLTPDRDLLVRAVRSTGAHGSTALYNAVYISLKQFGQSAHGAGDAVRRQAIVVLSDGQDTTSIVKLEDVMDVAHQMGVNVYTVGLQSRLDERRLAEDGGHRYLSESDYAMQTMARETGAQAFFPSPSDLKSVYSRIASELATQYSIGYVPANNHPDGRFRRVIVQIITRPSLHPRTRSGYTADGRTISASHQR